MNDFELIKTAAFLKKRLRAIKAAGTGRRARETLLSNLCWHMGRNHMVCIKQNNKITGVGYARGIDRVEEAGMNYKFNDEGKILFIENVAADTEIAFKHLLLWARRRWPHAEQILFRRSKNGSKNKLYDFNTFILKACL